VKNIFLRVFIFNDFGMCTEDEYGIQLAISPKIRLIPKKESIKYADLQNLHSLMCTLCFHYFIADLSSHHVCVLFEYSERARKSINKDWSDRRRRRLRGELARVEWTTGR
jgi:hypothetical protein